MPKSREQAKEDAAKLQAKLKAEKQAEANKGKNLNFADWYKKYQRTTDYSRYDGYDSILKNFNLNNTLAINPLQTQADKDAYAEYIAAQAKANPYEKFINKNEMATKYGGSYASDGADTYTDGLTGKQKPVPTNVDTFVATGQTYSGDKGNASGIYQGQPIVVDKKVVTQQAPTIQKEASEIIPAVKPNWGDNPGFVWKNGKNVVGDGTKKVGGGFWSADTNSKYWETPEGITKSKEVWGSVPGWIKQEPKKELDVQAFKNLFSSWF